MLTDQLIDFAFSFSLFYATHLGLGLHASDISPHLIPRLNRAEYAFTVLYVSLHEPIHTCKHLTHRI